LDLSPFLVAESENNVADVDNLCGNDQSPDNCSIDPDFGWILGIWSNYPYPVISQEIGDHCVVGQEMEIVDVLIYKVMANNMSFVEMFGLAFAEELKNSYSVILNLHLKNKFVE
jgi:hypothetical protein